MLSRFILSVALAAALPSLATAHTPAPGWQLTSAPNPAFGSVLATLPGGDLVSWDGNSVERWSAAGAHLSTLHIPPAFVFASFVESNAAGDAVVIGESSNGDLFLVATDGSGASLLTNLPLNYDGLFDAAGDLIVSAKALGTGSDNQFHRVQVPSGASIQIGAIAGASGPLAIAPGGDLYYATNSDVFPAPPGSTDVLRWDAALLGSSTFLDSGNAQVHGAGFHNGSSLALDPVGGAVLLAENVYSSSTYSLFEVGSDRSSSTLVASPSNWCANLQVLDGPGPGSFAAFQPAGGVSLRYTATDFFSADDVVTVDPRRPVLALSGPGTGGVGSVTLTLDGGVPNGAAFLLYTAQTSLQAPATYTFPGFLWHTSFNPGRTRRMGFFVPADANGKSEVVLWNPGNLSGKYAWQFWVAGPTGAFRGASGEAIF